MIKLLADENIPRSFTEQLRKGGVDILSVEDLGMKGADDDEIMGSAINKGRVVVTFDKDYLGELAERHEHPGILAFTRPLGIGDMIRAVQKVINHMTVEDISGTIQYLPWSEKN